MVIHDRAMEEAGTILVLIVLGAWLAATVISAFPAMASVLNRLGTFTALVPRWNFFSPRPGIHDYHLLYRDQWEGGGVGVWQEVPGFAQPRNLTASVWNPHRVSKKALFDLAVELARESLAVENRQEYAKLSIPYLVLLNYVSQLPRPHPSIATQFMLARSSSMPQTVEPCFISGLHSLS